MNNPTERELKQTIKYLLKKNNLTYEELAPAIGLTLAGTKRLMNKGQLTIERGTQIAYFFGLTFTEFIHLSQNHPTHVQILSEKQESELARHPLGLKILILLTVGFSLKDIQKKISNEELRRLDKTLLVLDRLDLINLKNMDKVVLIKKGPYKFRKNGLLEKKFLKPYLGLISKLMIENRDALVNRNFEVYLSKNSILKLKTELEDLISKCIATSSADVRALNSENVFPVTLSFFASELDGWGLIFSDARSN